MVFLLGFRRHPPAFQPLEALMSSGHRQGREKAVESHSRGRGQSILGSVDEGPPIPRDRPGRKKIFPPKKNFLA
jgi:hypothetical protein